jgi:hypothetical protein
MYSGIGFLPDTITLACLAIVFKRPRPLGFVEVEILRSAFRDINIRKGRGQDEDDP